MKIINIIAIMLIMDEENDLTEEDLELWYYVSQSVEPMNGKEPVPIPTRTNSNSEPDKDNNINEEDLQRLIEKQQLAKKSSPKLNYLKHGTLSGVDKATARKLTKGKFNIQAKLDLHGRTQDEALHALKDFIKNCHESAKRSVIVVTGKGANNEGILKQQVPRWLNSPSIREHIIMFSYAQPKHGGDGALYILLKKNK